MRGRRVRDPMVGLGWLVLMLAAASVGEGVMVALGSPQHVWFWCAFLRMCSQ